MYEIGRIARLQVQRDSLKAGQRPHCYYDPAPLLAVPRLRLAPAGAIGLTDDGHELVDVHHTAHPATLNRGGKNGVSLGFTSHYQAMRAHLGPHITDGVAGENILIAASHIFRLADLGEELLIQGDDGRQVRLGRLLVAAPCVEFSRFACVAIEPLSAEALRPTLQFLDGGMRGFYASPSAAAELRLGDRVLVTRIAR